MFHPLLLLGVDGDDGLAGASHHDLERIHDHSDGVAGHDALAVVEAQQRRELLGVKVYTGRHQLVHDDELVLLALFQDGHQLVQVRLGHFEGRSVSFVHVISVV